MSSNKTTKDFPLFVRKEITHKEITVTYEVDFLNKRVSLVERNGDTKKWLFNNRGVSYLESWKVILDAMEIAITEAQEQLEEYLELEQSEHLKLVEGIEKIILTDQ